jgi:SAM-dependent methyltransferase
MTWLAEMEARRLVLSLREMLVRHDENQAANLLMQHCVPYVCERDPEILRARSDQAEMVEHLSSPEAYARYYRSNVHERPFEEQYRTTPEQAHEHIPRVQLLRDELLREHRPLGTILDVGCNDGWLAANLSGPFPDMLYHGIDLNPDCVKRAKARKVPGATFAKGQLYENAAGLLDDPYDVAVCFEVIEHVRDPDELLALLACCVKPAGRLIISTPCGAVERGDLPQWWHVEPKGHVRVYTPESFHALLSRHGTPGQMVLGPDGVLVCPVRVGEPD